MTYTCLPNLSARGCPVKKRSEWNRFNREGRACGREILEKELERIVKTWKPKGEVEKRALMNAMYVSLAEGLKVKREQSVEAKAPHRPASEGGAEATSAPVQLGSYSGPTTYREAKPPGLGKGRLIKLGLELG